MTTRRSTKLSRPWPASWCSDAFREYRKAVEFGEDGICGLGPDKRFWVSIVLGKIGVDSGLQVDDRAEDAAADALPGHLGEEVLDRIEPRGRSRGEVEDPARMTGQPSQHLGMFVGGIVVEHRMDQLAGRDFALDGVEEADEFAVAVALHAAADDGAVEYAERGEQGGRAVPLVIMRHSLTTPRLDRQPRLGAVEGLDLALFVEREHHTRGPVDRRKGRQHRPAW